MPHRVRPTYTCPLACLQRPPWPPATAALLLTTAAGISLASLPMGSCPLPGREDDPELEAKVIRKILLADATFGCSIQLRYDAPTPNLLTIGYVGGNSCNSTHET